MRKRGPFLPVVPAAVVYLAIAVPGAILLLGNDPTIGSAVLLLGNLGLVLFMRWYSRKYLG